MLYTNQVVIMARSENKSIEIEHVGCVSQTHQITVTPVNCIVFIHIVG